MRTNSNRSIPTPVAAMLVIGLASFASASWAHDQKVCVTATVPEAFTLPDGSTHASRRRTDAEKSTRPFHLTSQLHRNLPNEPAATSRFRLACISLVLPVLSFQRIGLV